VSTGTTAGGPIADQPVHRSVLGSATVFTGHIWDVATEKVDLGDGQTVQREFIRHPGAVAVIALSDDDEVLLVHQYRHPVGAVLWEPPAGLRDVDGEPPVETAKRELFEEAQYRASTWHLLTELFTTPGSSSERILVYLARGLTPVPAGEQYERHGEEKDMPVVWVPLDDVVDGVLAGRLLSPTLVSGALAAQVARSRDWSTLRPV
jgi:8-oxo-dGTP pyrophosphatase MutT (NUDIX family)